MCCCDCAGHRCFAPCVVFALPLWACDMTNVTNGLQQDNESLMLQWHKQTLQALDNEQCFNHKTADLRAGWMHAYLCDGGVEAIRRPLELICIAIFPLATLVDIPNLQGMHCPAVRLDIWLTTQSSSRQCRPASAVQMITSDRYCDGKAAGATSL